MARVQLAIEVDDLDGRRRLGGATGDRRRVGPGARRVLLRP